MCKIFLESGVVITDFIFFNRKNTLFPTDPFTQPFKTSVFYEKIMKVLKFLHFEGIMTSGTRLSCPFAIDHGMLWVTLGAVGG